jgi:hypothetical protein
MMAPPEMESHIDADDDDDTKEEARGFRKKKHNKRRRRSSGASSSNHQQNDNHVMKKPFRLGTVARDRMHQPMTNESRPFASTTADDRETSALVASHNSLDLAEILSHFMTFQPTYGEPWQPQLTGVSARTNVATYHSSVADEARISKLSSLNNDPSLSMEFLPLLQARVNLTCRNLGIPQWQTLHPHPGLHTAIDHDQTTRTSRLPTVDFLKSCYADPSSNWGQDVVPQSSLKSIGPATRFPQALATNVAALPDSFISPGQIQQYQTKLSQLQLQALLMGQSPAVFRLQNVMRTWERNVGYGTEQLLHSFPYNPISVPRTNHAKFTQHHWNRNEAHEEKIIADVGVMVAAPEDERVLNEPLIFLRKQIEYFRATVDDVMSHTRGRNKAITMRQVGIRCRHCAHIPVDQRRKGSTYFPSTLMGIYQAAQNISVEHFQSGLCSELPNDVKNVIFERKGAVKKSSSSYAGKGYWAESARKLGLIDTDEGIRFAADVANSMQVPANLIF